MRFGRKVQNSVKAFELPAGGTLNIGEPQLGALTRNLRRAPLFRCRLDFCCRLTVSLPTFERACSF